MFEGCTNLSEDFYIPSHVVDCSNAFKDCINMTHVHSNWDNEYDNEIISIDCYAGCTEITHVDDIDIGKSEYKNGLDDVHTSWGGYGFGSDVTGIYIFEIPEDNYTLTIEQWGNGLIGEKKVF